MEQDNYGRIIWFYIVPLILKKNVPIHIFRLTIYTFSANIIFIYVIPLGYEHLHMDYCFIIPRTISFLKITPVSKNISLCLKFLFP